MKNFSLILLWGVLLNACGNQNTSDDPAIDMNGPDVELNLVEFDTEKRQTRVELINRLDEEIKTINGTLFFYDESGAEITYATGLSKSSPFSKSKAPHLVRAGSKVTLELGNKIPENTASIQVKKVEVKTTSGETITVESK